MDLLTLFLLAVGLSMDAFAVSICKGLAMKKLTVKQAVIVGAWFGGFQALMPTLGYLLGTTFARFVNAVSDWITFVLLALIGANTDQGSFIQGRGRRGRCFPWREGNVRIGSCNKY